MKHDVKLIVSVAWWLHPYIRALAFFCVLTGNEPDEAKLHAKIKRAIRVRVQ